MNRFEQIARKFCELRGIDPNEQFLVPCPDNKPGCLVCHYGPRWKQFESMAHDQLAWFLAIENSNEPDTPS